MRVRHILALLAAGSLLYLLLWPTGGTFEAFTYPDPPAWEGPLAVDEALRDLPATAEVGEGPEDVAVAADGTLYTGIADGHIMLLEPGAKEWRPLTLTYGRPLGLAFSPDERWLYVADAERGLMRTDRAGHLERLVDTLGGEDLGLVDDLAVGADGHVYFTTASTRHAWDESRDAMLEHHGTGKLLRYDPVTRRLDLLIDDLQFANGVALVPDGSAVLVAATGGYRVLRYGLRGRDSARVTVFADNLPGFPDGLDYDPRGRLWVSIPNRRNALLERLGPRPFMREVVYRLPEQFKPQPERYGLVLALDAQGRIVESLHDPTGDLAAVTNFVWAGPDTAYAATLVGRELRRYVR